jgi:hypothetical protein
MSIDKPPGGEKPAVRDNSFAGHDPRDIIYDNRVERAYWLKLFGVSDEELRTAIAVVGVSAQSVKDYLAAR